MTIHVEPYPVRPSLERFQWTDEAVEYLRANWPTQSGSMIGRALGTSANSVVGKAWKLGLQKNGPCVYAWPESSVNILVGMAAAGARAREIGDRLGISRYAVHNKAIRLGIKLSIEPVERAPKPKAARKKVAPVRDPLPFFDFEPIPYLSAPEQKCKWIVVYGDDVFEHMSCGNDRLPTDPSKARPTYCVKHREIAYAGAAR